MNLYPLNHIIIEYYSKDPLLSGKMAAQRDSTQKPVKSRNIREKVAKTLFVEQKWCNFARFGYKTEKNST